MTIKQQGGIFGRNPTFNDVEVAGNLTVGGSTISTVGTIASQDADNVNIDGGSIDGANIGANSAGTGNFTNLTATGSVDFSNGTGSNVVLGNSGSFAGAETAQLVFEEGATELAQIQWNPTGNTFVIENKIYNAPISFRTFGANERLKIDGSNGNIEVSDGNVVISTSGQGIDFSATSGTGTSELFDDYEEGTWTPAFTTTGTDFSSITYDTQSGHYTKVGRLVTARGFIRTDAITVGSASGSVLISGLPYTSTSPAVGSVGATYNWGGDVPLSVTIFNSATTLYMYYRTSVNGIDNAIAPSDMGTGANNNDIYFTISYMAS